jgi:hypothetical protein
MSKSQAIVIPTSTSNDQDSLYRRSPRKAALLEIGSSAFKSPVSANDIGKVGDQIKGLMTHRLND